MTLIGLQLTSGVSKSAVRSLFNPSNIPLHDVFQLGERDGDCGSIITAHCNVIIDIIVHNELKLPYLRKARLFRHGRCARCFSQVRDWTRAGI